MQIEPFSIEFKDEWYSVSPGKSDKKTILTVTNVLSGEELEIVLKDLDEKNYKRMKEKINKLKDKSIKYYAQYKYLEEVYNQVAEAFGFDVRNVIKLGNSK